MTGFMKKFWAFDWLCDTAAARSIRRSRKGALDHCWNILSVLTLKLGPSPLRTLDRCWGHNQAPDHELVSLLNQRLN